MWPSGKAAAFGAAIRGFESLHPSQEKWPTPGRLFFLADMGSKHRVRRSEVWRRNIFRAQTSGEGVAAIPPPQPDIYEYILLI